MTWWLRVNSYSGDEGYRTREIPVRGTQAQVERIADRINKTRNHYHAEAFEYPDVVPIRLSPVATRCSVRTGG